MASTSTHGIVYPTTADNVALASHYQNLAASVETALTTYETWTAWVPAWTGGGFTSVGAGGVNEGFYQQIGKLVHAEFRIQLGTAPTVVAATLFHLTLPVAAYVWGSTGNQSTLGSWAARDNSALTHYSGSIALNNPAQGAVFDGAWSGTVPSQRMSDTLPFAWAIDDVLSGSFTYRAA